jgi:hypothetical protein
MWACLVPPGLEPLSGRIGASYATVGDLMLIRHIRGMRSCWSGEDDQLNGRMEVTVVVRSIPRLSV